MKAPPAYPTRAAPLRRLGLALSLLLVVGGGGAPPVRAQDAGAQRVTLAVVGVPLQEALEALIDRTRIALVYDNALVAGRTAFCRAERTPLEDALACVLRGTGLDYARLSSGTYTLFVRPEEGPQFGGIEGEIVDAETGAPLPGAHVLVRGTEGPRAGAAANGSGRFTLVRLLPGAHDLVVSHVGYRRAALTVRVEAENTNRLALALQPEPVLVPPLVVSGMERQALSDRLGGAALGEGALTAAPPADPAAPVSGAPLAPTPATPDVMRALDGVVGVRAGEALADVHVQGGAVGEHAFLLDGAPVLVPVSLGGLVGPFSPFALTRVEVQKAGFEASHGSHLAGVVAAESAVAPPAGQAFAAQVDPLSLNVRWGGRGGQPERVERSWAVALRQGLWGAVQPPALADRLRSWSAPDTFLIAQLGQPPVPTTTGAEGFPVELGFTDAHAAGRLRLGGLRSLQGSLYLARHAFGVEDTGTDSTPSDELYEDAYRWRSLMGQGRYEWVHSARAFAHVGAWVSGYRLGRPSVLGTIGTPDEDFNGMDAGGVRAGLDVAATPRHWITSRVEVTRYDGDLSSAAGLPGDGSAFQPLTWSVAGAGEDRIALGARAALTLGARLTWLPEGSALYAEPRVAFRYDGPDGALGPWALRLAAGRYLQFLTAVDVADGGPAPLLPRVRFWLPLGAGERPPEAYHLATEALLQPAPTWEVGAEAYLKHQPHLLVPNYSGESDGPLTPAEGYAYGLAFRVERSTEKLRMAVAYEYAVARHHLPGRFGGGWVPAPWDAPHRLRATLDAVPLPHLTVTLRAESVLGRAWGFRQAYYDLLEPGPATHLFAPFDLSDPGAHRLPAFAQVDVNVAYTTTVAGVGVQVRVGLLNALARDNVRDWLLVYDEMTGTYRRRERYAMPFLPVFALRVTR